MFKIIFIKPIANNYLINLLKDNYKEELIEKPVFITHFIFRILNKNNSKIYEGVVKLQLKHEFCYNNHLQIIFNDIGGGFFENRIIGFIPNVNDEFLCVFTAKNLCDWIKCKLLEKLCCLPHIEQCVKEGKLIELESA